MTHIQLVVAEDSSDPIQCWLAGDDYSVFGRAEPLDSDRSKQRGFSGNVGETAWFDREGGGSFLYGGVGKRDRVSLESLRRAGAALVQRARHAERVTLDLHDVVFSSLTSAAIAQAIGEGMVLGSYHYDAERTSPATDALSEVTFVGDEEVAAGVHRAIVISEQVCLARDLINTPPSDLTPTRFSDIATELAHQYELSVVVLDEDALIEGGFGGLLGVARGSREPARFVKMTYEPPSSSATTVALVGKGVTFDSGGLSLKSAEGMVTMKTDMSGAAAVLTTLVAAKGLSLPLRLVGYMPLVENMPGGAAIKPGDVLTTKSGKTIEVINTDAEGRLILADALFVAAEEKPDAIIDLATLTGACVQALGYGIAGLMGNNQGLIEALYVASQATGEPHWPLPVPSGYRSKLDSDVADMRNIASSGQGAGALFAALLLEEFIGSVPWAHLDIAGPARASDDRGYLRKGATGFGVRTLIELLSHYTPIGGESAGWNGKVVMG